jgi:hypothetical protein
MTTFHVLNTVTCVAHLTLVKEINNPFPGVELAPLTSWTLRARRLDSTVPVISGTTGVTGTIMPGVRYVLSESSVPGYRQEVDPNTGLVEGATGSWRCVQVVDGAADLEVFAGGDGTVKAAPGEDIECTATNIPQPAKLTLIKHVVNDFGGKGKPTDWTLTATPRVHRVPPAPRLKGVTGSKSVTNVAIPPGVPYYLGEFGIPGYDPHLACTANRGRVDRHGRILTAAIGQRITCIFTNTQAPPVPVTG